MKTSWSETYLNRMPPLEVHEWRMAKSRALEDKTGVPWTSYTAHGKRVFFPVLVAARTKPSSEGWEALEVAWQARKDASGYVTFLALAEETVWPLPRVMAVALGMIRAVRATVTVGRMGKAVALKVYAARSW